MTRTEVAVTIRWAARGLSAILLAMFGLIIVDDAAALFRMPAREAALFAFFPVGFCAALVLAWKKEVLGGCLALACMAAFYALHFFTSESQSFPRGPYFLLTTAPALLFLIAAALSRR